MNINKLNRGLKYITFYKHICCRLTEITRTTKPNKNNLMPLPEEKKITVIFRIEAGCLGPQGISHVAKFCAKAHQSFSNLNSGFMNWKIIPRHDKSLPELDYSIAGRPLTREHASKYLQHFDLEIDKFEMELFDKLPEMIDQYFGR